MNYKWNSNGVKIDWTEIPHGTVLTKFIAKSDKEHTGIERNGKKIPHVTLHGFVDDHGNFYIVDEIVNYDGEDGISSDIDEPKTRSI